MGDGHTPNSRHSLTRRARAIYALARLSTSFVYRSAVITMKHHMNRLSTHQRVQIVSALVEGCSVNSSSRLTGASKVTILKFLANIGTACRIHHDQTVKGLRCKRIQCDEVWAFCGMKDKNVPLERAGEEGIGSVWTWTALCPDTKLLVSLLVGRRDEETAREFILDLAGRLVSRVQLTTDGNLLYLPAVKEAFGRDVDYAVVMKQYDGAGRYIGAAKRALIGRCKVPYISTSLVERQNLTMRMGMRRYTRKTNGFSKKLVNMQHMAAIHTTYYNFCRVHQTIRVTPAMEAGLADHVWEIGEMVDLLETAERAAIAAGALQRGRYRKRDSN